MGKKPTFRQIEAFRAVILTGSVSGGAEFLGLTQPAVSRLLRDLEYGTRLPLFKRTGNAVEPNPEALLLYREVQRYFIGLEQIDITLRHIRDAKLGVLRVACNTGAAMRLMPYVIAKYMDNHPGAEITLRNLNSEDVVEGVSLRRYDIGLAHAPAGIHGVEVEAISGLKGLCAIPFGHNLTEKAVITPDDLRDVPLLSLGLTNPVWASLHMLFELRGILPTVAAQVSASESLCTLVALGRGVGIIDPFAAYQFTDPRVVLRPFEPDLDYPHAIIFPGGTVRSRAVDEFAGLLRAELAELIDGSRRTLKP